MDFVIENYKIKNFNILASSSYWPFCLVFHISNFNTWANDTWIHTWDNKKFHNWIFWKVVFVKPLKRLFEKKIQRKLTLEHEHDPTWASNTRAH